MGKIFVIMGKSASGKDTVYKMLLERFQQELHTIVGYTTRPIREGEVDGVEYYFVNETQVEKLEKLGKIMEIREYQTIMGPWKYFTADDDQIDLSKNNYLVIGTLQSYQSMVDYLGKDALVPIYITLDDGERLERAIKREKKQAKPNYAEVCRRFLADDEDFSEKNLLEAGIMQRFYNQTIEETVEEIAIYMCNLM